jgi:glycosyltransferase involved in cell wall biosynthesis
MKSSTPGRGGSSVPPPCSASGPWVGAHSAARSLRILQVSTADVRGGAEKVATDLWQSYRDSGHAAWLAVGRRRAPDSGACGAEPQTRPTAAEVAPGSRPADPGFPRRHGPEAWDRPDAAGDTRPLLICEPQRGKASPGSLRSLLERGGGRARSAWSRLRGAPTAWCGHEVFDFPATWRLLDLPPERPEILHCHNLHGGYFDLRALSWLSRQLPVVVTLHDMWMLSGHCAYSMGCERWRIGCGHCPDLHRYPAIRCDGTAYNWRRKEAIFRKCRLYVAAPAQWLLQQVEESMLAPGIVESRVIPNGVDLSIFRPMDRDAARTRLGIPTEASVLLFTANGVRRNGYKDYQTIRDAVVRVTERWHAGRVIFIALGEQAPPERIGPAEIRFIPYQTAPETVAAYYQAADIYLHAAHADTFPMTILEALACGRPVVATAVGGIPEQVREDVTGFCVPEGDGAAMAGRVLQLLQDGPLRSRIGAAAAAEAVRRFDLRRQRDDYLAWYEAILDQWCEDSSPLTALRKGGT